MTNDVTISVRTARIDARILTFLIDASQAIGTLAIANALRSAIRRTADEVG